MRRSPTKTERNSCPRRDQPVTLALPIFEINQGQYTERVRDALGTAFGRFRNPDKQLARAADCNVHTAKNWLAGKSSPQGLHLLRLLAAVLELQAEVRRLTGMIADGDPDVQRVINDLVTVELRRRKTTMEGAS